jgi:hypothetical protein
LSHREDKIKSEAENKNKFATKSPEINSQSEEFLRKAKPCETPELTLKTERSADLSAGSKLAVNKNAHELPMSARIKQFITEEGLSELSGCSKKEFVRFLVKETIDNALGVKKIKHVTVRIWREAAALCISVSNDGAVSEEDCMTLGKIEDVLLFDYSASSKNAKHIIDLGSKGNALPTCIGGSYGSWPDCQRPEFTTEITSYNLRFKIKLLPHDDVIDHAPIIPESIENDSVTTFFFKLNISEFETPRDIVLFFARLHRSVVFDYSCVDESPLLLNFADSAAFENPLSVDQGVGSACTYSLNDLLKLVGRLKSCVKTANMTMRKFIEKFQGFSHYAARVCKDVGIEQETISNISESKLEELLNYMKKEKPLKKPRKDTKDFPSVGDALKKDENDVLGWFSAVCVDTEKGCLLLTSEQLKKSFVSPLIPFVVEAVAFKRQTEENSINGKKPKHLFVAVNFSPNLHDPFKSLKVEGTPSDDDIYDIVDKSGLDVILHLVCPNITWKDPSKGSFDTNPFLSSIFKVIKNVCKKHFASSMDPQALIDASNKLLDGHPNADYSLREMHYKHLSTIPEYTKISSDPYAKLGKAIKIARTTKGERGAAHRQLDPDRIRDNSRPAYILNPPHRSFDEYLKYGYRKLVEDCDLERWESQNYMPEVWIEKEALSQIIKPICEKYRVNLFVGKGSNSFTQVYQAVRDRFPRDGRCFVVLYFGDHDKPGLKIEDSLKKRIIAEVKMQGIQIDDDNIHESIIFQRCALRYDQIKEGNLPSIPMTPKEIKSSPEYVAAFGPQKWELDVLEPERLIEECEAWIQRCISDWDAWNERDQEVEHVKQVLRNELQKQPNEDEPQN